MFETISPKVELTSSLAWGIEGAGWGQANLNDGSGKIKKMFQRLQKFDRKAKKRSDSSNQWRNVLIAETAIKNGATLMSDDKNLRQVISEFGGQVIESTSIFS